MSAHRVRTLSARSPHENTPTTPVNRASGNTKRKREQTFHCLPAFFPSSKHISYPFSSPDSIEGSSPHLMDARCFDGFVFLFRLLFILIYYIEECAACRFFPGEKSFSVTNRFTVVSTVSGHASPVVNLVRQSRTWSVYRSQEEWFYMSSNE